MVDGRTLSSITALFKAGWHTVWVAGAEALRCPGLAERETPLVLSLHETGASQSLCPGHPKTSVTQKLSRLNHADFRRSGEPSRTNLFRSLGLGLHR